MGTSESTLTSHFIFLPPPQPRAFPLQFTGWFFTVRFSSVLQKRGCIQPVLFVDGNLVFTKLLLAALVLSSIFIKVFLSYNITDLFIILSV